jgi:site-specific recombinase XerD
MQTLCGYVGLIVALWRAGLRISEALALTESDLDPSRGAILVRHGKGGKRREVGMDRWAWEQLNPWLQLRATLPVGSLFCVLRGPTRGRPWAPAGVRSQLHMAAGRAGVRRRFAPHHYADLWVMPTSPESRCKRRIWLSERSA